MTAWSEIERQVQSRANDRCEYWRVHQSLQGATFHIEHIVPRSRGGLSTLENLAWACPGCNLRKADRTEFPDPETNELTPLFNPRTDLWNEHFRWDEYVLIPLTPIGRATLDALDLNHERRIRIRKAEALFELFPPDE